MTSSLPEVLTQGDGTISRRITAKYEQPRDFVLKPQRAGVKPAVRDFPAVGDLCFGEHLTPGRVSPLKKPHVCHKHLMSTEYSTSPLCPGTWGASKIKEGNPLPAEPISKEHRDACLISCLIPSQKTVFLGPRYSENEGGEHVSYMGVTVC